MTNTSFAIVILAAGKGTRLKSRRPKVLHEIGGKPLLAHVVAAASKVVAPQNIFAIIGHEAEKVRAALQSSDIGFVLQREQRGTGHAMMEAAAALKSFDHVLVLSGDVPLITEETITRVRDFHLDRGAAMTILTAEPATPPATDESFVSEPTVLRRTRWSASSSRKRCRTAKQTSVRSTPAFTHLL